MRNCRRNFSSTLSTLTLLKAVNQVSQSEAVKKQQALIRNNFKESTGTKNEVDTVKNGEI